MLGEWTAEQVIGGLEAAFRRNPDAAMYSVSPVSDLPCEGRIEDPHLIQATALALGLDSPARIHLLYHARALGTGESIYKLCPDPRDFLMAAKAPGKKPGNPNLAAARKRAVEDNKSAASRYAANVLPVVREIQASGVKSLRSVARALTARGIPTARGGTWTPAQVSAILRRGG
jgi:hypothetical protein